jgi:eukaryotic-like serine/threonine-protein kinase
MRWTSTERRVSSWLGIMAGAEGEKTERDISWLDRSLLTGLSRDGRRILFTQFGSSVDTTYEGYLRKLEESSPMLIGEGFAQALSPDGSRVLAVVPAATPELVVRPTAASAGQPMKIVPRGLEAVIWADWFPDGRRVVVAGIEPGLRPDRQPHGVRLYSCEPESGEVRAISPEGVIVDHYQGVPVSPDGRRLAAIQSDGRLAVFSTDGGEARPIPNLPPGVVPIAWTADSRKLFAYGIYEQPARVIRLDPETGKAEPWKELLVADGAGVHGVPSVRMTGDGRAYAYSYYRALSELFAVDGLR